MVNLDRTPARGEDAAAPENRTHSDQSFRPGIGRLLTASGAELAELRQTLRAAPLPGTAARQPAPKWDMRSVEPELIRISSSPLNPSREVLGVVWEGKPMPLDTFLATAGDQGWEIVAAGNTSERHHRLYLKRPKY